MPYYLSNLIGDGSDAEGNAIRPVLANYGEAWTSLCTVGNRAIVRANHIPAFDSDPNIRPLLGISGANVEALSDSPFSGEDGDALATLIVRRFLTKQLLGGDDFPALTLTIGDIPPAKRQRINQVLQNRGVDTSGLSTLMTVADGLKFVLPQLKVRIHSKAAAPGGTFTDNFNGEGSSVDLAAHTPSGGTAWTRIDGSANMATVLTANILNCNTTDVSGALYVCDDQGSANHYLQYNAKSTIAQAFVANRATDRDNFIGTRLLNTKVEIYKRVTSTFTQLGSTGTTVGAVDDVIRLESDSADAHEAFLNAASEVGPATDAFNSSETRQGVVARKVSGDWLDNFEAGTLAAGGLSIPGSHSLMGVGI